MRVARKLILMVSIVILMIFSLVGITACETDDIGPAPKTEDSVFVQVGNRYKLHSVYYYICYHKETKVMYVVTYSNSYGNPATFTVLLDEEGNPMIYEEAVDE